MRFVSLFSGVGGFDLGLEQAGMECVAQVEWDRNCQAILAKHWPKTPRWGDVAKVYGRHLPPAEVVAFGSPCQDLSHAGKRAGLNGDKSGLFFQAIRIIKEMRDASASRPTGPIPRYAIWENVPGALNSNNGRDFRAVIDALADIGAVAIEWAVLDAQHFGVPQRRRRIFLVAIFDPATAERCPDPLLPVGKGRRGNTSESRTTLEDDTPTTRGRSDDSREQTPEDDSVTVFQPGVMVRQGAGVLRDLVPSLRAEAHAGDNQAHIAQPIGFSHTQGLDPQASELAWPTLRSEGGGHAVLTDYALRKLTPLECERLMGWPDDHTRWRADGQQQADAHRYRQCGNGVASPVARWVAEQIIRLEASNGQKS